MSTTIQPTSLPQTEQSQAPAVHAPEANRAPNGAVILFDRANLQTREDVDGVWTWAAAKLGNLPEDVATDAADVAQELAENAFLYGKPLTDKGYALKAVRTNEALHVSSSNRIHTTTDLGRLVDVLDLIRKGDPAEVYTQALKAMADQPIAEASGTGLMRIAAESGFSLDWHVDGDVVTVTATRAV